MKTLLILYDIPLDKTRTKVANKLQEYGLERIQYSVFIGKIKVHNYKALSKKLEDLINKETDKIYLLEPGLNNLLNTKMLGIFTDIKSILEPPQTLFV